MALNAVLLKDIQDKFFPRPQRAKKTGKKEQGGKRTRMEPTNEHDLLQPIGSNSTFKVRVQALFQRSRLLTTPPRARRLPYT
jgi:hypothetical protein